MISKHTRIAVAAVAAALALVPAAGAQASQKCQPAHSTTLASDSFARVYGRGVSAFVCIRSSGRTIRLNGAMPTTDVFALGGNWVGYAPGPWSMSCTYPTST
jgi:hypothetical protein